MSCVSCQVSHVTFFFWQNGEAYPWNVCHQRGFPCLVYKVNCTEDFQKNFWLNWNCIWKKKSILVAKDYQSPICKWLYKWVTIIRPRDASWRILNLWKNCKRLPLVVVFSSFTIHGRITAALSDPHPPSLKHQNQKPPPLPPKSQLLSKLGIGSLSSIISKTCKSVNLFFIVRVHYLASLWTNAKY